MNAPLQAGSQPLKELAGGWAGYAAMGSFALYLLGYLSLRFHLMCFGINADLAVLDERYLFAGARFMVYLAAAVPSLVLVLLPLWLVMQLGGRLVPAAALARGAVWCRAPARLAAAGILWSVAWTQFVMRQVWVLADLLLAERLPPVPDWLAGLLLQPARLTWFFMALLAALGLSLAVLCRLLQLGPGLAPTLRPARTLLALLVAIQALMLPVNYGMLILDHTLPRVAAAGPRALAVGETAWLVWEGNDRLTFLLRSADGRHRSLLTHEREQVPSIEVIGSDVILQSLFDTASAAAPTRIKP